MIFGTCFSRGSVQFLCWQEVGALRNLVKLHSEAAAGAAVRSQPQRVFVEFMATKTKTRQEWKTVRPQAAQPAATTPDVAVNDSPADLKKPEGLEKVKTKVKEVTEKEAVPELKQPAGVANVKTKSEKNTVATRIVAASPRSIWVAKSQLAALQTSSKPVQAGSTPETLKQASPGGRVTIDARQLARVETVKMVPKTTDSKVEALVQAHIRATFYPKFENEKSDQDVRARMIELVSCGDAVLEVSLKHSGSLFMYSGAKGGAYAKNSYGNLYTATGVFVLGRTLQEAWGAQAANKQLEFNKYLDDNRICVAMELVTAVLGDHGQRPLKDYVVVTAVTDLKGRPKFYSTPDVVAFCRKWRLPSNHYWLFSSKKSVSAFFTAYDALCEEGLASTVSHTLNEIADISVPATKDHQVVQGEILEGLVARVISSKTLVQMKSTIEQFPLQHSDSPAVGPGLREIFAANKKSEGEQKKALLLAVGSNFAPDHSDWLNEDAVTVQSVKKADTPVLSRFLQATPADKATTKVQELIRLLRKKNMQVRFKCCLHSDQKGVSDQDGGFRLTIHVLADSVFRRYQNEMKNQEDLWPLYRGFFLDVKFCGPNASKVSASQDMEQSAAAEQVCGIGEPEKTGTTENLMLKLKFLPYKLRTFLIRNGLKVLYTNGEAAYREYYFKQMKNWGTSAEKRRDLSQLLNEWALYITKKTKGKQLSGDTYLSEAEPFLEKFAMRSAKNKQLVGSAGTIINVEEFLAEKSVEDETGLRDENSLADSSSPSTSPQPEGVKAKGLLVFFPGIPGCAKSALSKHLLNVPKGLGDGRKLMTLMGDLIKGRYWQRLAADQKKNPSVVMLADKNAPNEDVWKQIETICQSTQALGVPVVTESEGTSSNPYSLDALVVFTYRILQRVNHPGNLDKNSPTPGYVLLMFYHLYEGLDRKEFESTLMNRYGNLVKLPLLKKGRAKLPAEVLQVMQDGIALFKRHKAKHGKADALQGSLKTEWVPWENKLKDVLFANGPYLDGIQVPFEEVANSFTTQLKAIANGPNNMHISVSEHERSFSNVVFAAISLPEQEVLAALHAAAEANPKLKEYVRDKGIEKIVQRAHVTLAHKRSHGVAAVARYAEFRGAKVPVQLTAVIFSDKLCALEAVITSVPNQAISSRNPWPHVTLWVDKGTAAMDANALPRLLEAGQASRFDFPKPTTVVGQLKFM